MNSNKCIGRIVGILFILATVAGVISLGFLGPILHAPNYLIEFSKNETQINIAVLLIFIMGVTGASIGIMLYPVLRKYNKGLALGSAEFRLAEGVFHIVNAVGLVLLVTLSKEFVKAGTPDSTYFQTLGVLLTAGRSWISDVAALIMWCTGASMYYYIFYKAKLVPRWLSLWGLIGITLTVFSCILVMFHVLNSLTVAHTILNLPIALQEMVLAVWLIIKGFNNPMKG